MFQGLFKKSPKKKPSSAIQALTFDGLVEQSLKKFGMLLSADKPFIKITRTIPVDKLITVPGTVLAPAFQGVKPSVKVLDLSDCGFDSMPLREFLIALNSLPATLKMLNLGENNRTTQRTAEEQMILRNTFKNKSFIIKGNGCDVALTKDLVATLPFKESGIKTLIEAYLAEFGQAFFSQPEKRQHYELYEHPTP